MEQKRYNLIKTFSVGSLPVIVIAAILVGWLYREFAIDELKHHGHQNNIVLAQSMANAIWSQVETVMGMVPASRSFNSEEKAYSTLILDSAVRALIKDTNVIKIKIFNKAGRVIYSTEHGQIGALEKNQYFSSGPGKVETSLDFEEKIISLSGELNDRYILETYVPRFNADGKHVAGVFEIYVDITESYHYTKKTQVIFTIILFTILSLVYMFLFFIVRHASNVIKLQDKERENHLHEIQKANRDLDEYASELALMRDQALEASKAKSIFLANMSHELRTPLNAIIGYSEMLSEDMEDEGRQRDAEDLKKIKTAGSHLLSVINDILDLSKIESGRMELHLEKIDVKNTIEDVMQTVKPLADKEQNTLKVHIADDIDSMVTDLTRFRQVLLNLLSNACKFTSNGVINLDIAYSRNDPGMLCFVVKDTGVGMTGEQLENIFDAFKQADLSTTRRFGGTGLGLTISKRFADMLGGHISVTSEENIGSTFRIYLPENSSSSENPGVVSEPGLLIQQQVSFRKQKSEGIEERRSKVSKILAIDDDVAVTDLVERTLSSEGFEVKTVNDPVESLRVVEQWVPDAILLDVMMPELDGWAILKQIKNNKQLEHIPVIIMTVVDNYAMAGALGADGFVVKPINRKKLKNAITLCLRGNIQRKTNEVIAAQ